MAGSTLGGSATSSQRRPVRISLKALKRKLDKKADVTHLQKQQGGQDELSRRVPHRSGVRRGSSSASGQQKQGLLSRRRLHPADAREEPTPGESSTSPCLQPPHPGFELPQTAAQARSLQLPQTAMRLRYLDNRKVYSFYVNLLYSLSFEPPLAAALIITLITESSINELINHWIFSKN